MAKSTSKSTAKPAAKPAAKKPAAPAPAKKPAAPAPAAKKPAAAPPAKKPAAPPPAPAAAPAKKPAAPPPAPAAAPAKPAKPSKKPVGKAGYAVAEIVAASEAVDYRLLVRAANGTETYTEDTTEIDVAPPAWFALELLGPTTRRYLHLIQKEAATGLIVLMHLVDGAGATRVPAGNGWQRAVVEGSLHLIASDLLLSRPDIVELIGGHEPPIGTAKPPYT